MKGEESNICYPNFKNNSCLKLVEFAAIAERIRAVRLTIA